MKMRDKTKETERLRGRRRNKSRGENEDEGFDRLDTWGGGGWSQNSRENIPYYDH